MAEEKKQVSILAEEGKYLTFALGNEEYGVEILQVREIIGLMEITAVPQVPEYIKGVINLRGKVIPVIDLRLKFCMEAIAYTGETCIIVLQIHDTIMGIIVDRVCEVLDIAEKNIEAPPNFGTKINTDFITGMGKVADSVKILLNMQKIMTDDLALVSGIDMGE